MIIICDPGSAKPSAFAVFDNGKLIKTFKTNNLIELQDQFKNSNTLIMEDQYLGLNVKTLVGLVRQSGKIMGVAELMGLDIHLVAPVTWQSWHRIPRRTREFTVYKWKKIHEQCLIDHAGMLTGNSVKNCDEAAAILIGLYWIGVNK